MIDCLASIARRGLRAVGAALCLALVVSTVAEARVDAPLRTSPRTTLGILFPLFIGTSPNAIVAEARALGVDTVRLSDDVAVPGVRPAFDVFRKQRMKLVFTANYQQERNAAGHR